MDPIGGLDAAEIRKFSTLPGLDLQPLGCPSRSQSLSRLRCPYVSRPLWTKMKFVLQFLSVDHNIKFSSNSSSDFANGYTV
jgi:hypothetical protein